MQCGTDIMAAYLLQAAVTDPDAPWLFIMFGTAIAALFSALLTIVWTVIRRYEKMLDLNTTENKTLLEGSNRALTALQSGITTGNEQVKEQGRLILSDLREHRAGLNRTLDELLSAQKEMRRDIEAVKSRLDYSVRRAWPDPRDGEGVP